MKRKIQIIFFAYIVFLLLFVVFKILPSFEFQRIRSSIEFNRTDGYWNINLVPFKTIGKYLKDLPDVHAALNLFGNVVSFVPFGILFTAGFFKNQSLIKTGLAGLIFIISCEVLQFVTMTGFLDVDDIILNVLGVFLGYLVYLPIKSTIKALT